MRTILEIFTGIGAIITDDHIVYTSGKHGSVYVNKDILYPHTSLVSEIGSIIANECQNMAIDVVAAPALGGIILGQWTAYHLSQVKQREILSVYLEKDASKNLIFTRGYDALVQGKNVMVIEDILNTGGSLKKTIDSVRAAKGKVVVAFALVNRSPEAVTSEMIGAPLHALGELPTEIFDAAHCPLCAKNIPINTSVGHGKSFLEAQKKNA